MKFHEFFTNIFDKSFKPVINMDWSLILGDESVDLLKLIRDFALDEIKNAIFLFDGNKAPGLYGILVFFLPKVLVNG